jgi:glucose/arabinose dehydrogenase
MPHRVIRLVLGVLLACAASQARPGAALIEVPPGFQDVEVIAGVPLPSMLAFAPDGRLFVGAKSTGRIRIVENGELLDSFFLDVRDFVPAGAYFDTFFERGLLGLAFDPDFAANQLIYVYYTYCKLPGDPPRPGTNTCRSSKNRVIRLRANGNTVDRASHTVILDDVASDAGNHNGGWIDFGPLDGKLYVAIGDGGAVAAKAQDPTTPNGKVLRLNPDGTVPADNPFVGHPGVDARIWALGLRNPWRCRFAPDGRLFCADVGLSSREEINAVRRGANYGWPNTEGPFSGALFPQFAQPLHSYNHGGIDAAVIGGDFGARTDFPGDYQRSYFFGDFVRGFIRRIVLDATGTGVVTSEDFVTGLGPNSVTDIVAGPDGNLYYTKYAGGTVRKVMTVTGNRSPEAVAEAAPMHGDVPLAVQFSSAGSSDPDGDPLAFHWDFGDGSPPASDADPLHVYETVGPHTATLTVSDGGASSGPASDSVMVQVGTPPVVTIDAPLDGALFRAGDVVALRGGATGADGEPLPDAALSWQVTFHHDDHTHPFIDELAGGEQAFAAATTGEAAANVAYAITLRANDVVGLTGAHTVVVVPDTVTLTLASDPPGLELTLDGSPQAAPLAFTGVVGFERALGAPSPQVAGGRVYVFAGWSDGGAQYHTVATPGESTTYTAVFVGADVCDEPTVIAPAGDVVTGATSGVGRHAAACARDGAAPERAFAWTPAFSGLATIDTCGGGTQFDTVLYLRGADCGQNGSLGCSDDACANASGARRASRLTRPVTAGETLHVVVDGYDGAQGGFTLRAAPADAPVGQCGNPAVIPPGGGEVAGTTSGPSLQAGTCGKSGLGPEQAFQWTPAESGTAIIETCGTAFDSVLYLRSGACASGAQLACNDDTLGCAGGGHPGHGSRIALSVTAGETYFIVVDGYNGAAGDFTLRVTAPGAPLGDCADPWVVPPAGGVFTGTTAGAGFQAGTCGKSAAAPEQVFRWTPEASGTATIETCGAETSYDSVLYLRDGACDPDAQVTCNDDAIGCDTGEPHPSHGSRITTTVTAGETYFVVVDGFDGRAGDFRLTVTAPGAVAAPLR